MRKFFLSVLIVLIYYTRIQAQTVQGTLLQGSAANRVIVGLRSSAAFSAPFTNVQFVLQIPRSASPIPSVSISNNFIPANIPSYNFSTVNSSTPISFYDDGVSYYNYLFSSVILGGAPFNFTTTTSNILELQINGAPGTAEVRLANLINGGASFQHNFYIEVAGNDVTNELNMFYGAGSINNQTGSGYAGYSFMPVGSISLPVTFINFDARCHEKGAMITWSTASEQNSKNFEIQRSEDGTNWRAIGTVQAAGNSSNVRNYNYLDLEGGAAMYRIRQTDLDGRSTLTAVRRTDCQTSDFNVVLYPVPTRDNLTVVIRSDKDFKTDLQIIDMKGSIIRRIPTQINKGNNTINLVVAELPAGQYMLRSADAAGVVNKKFTVAR